MADRRDLLLPDGTPFDEGISALIKCLRRGLELDAMGWASLLVARYPWKTFRVLATFAAEDVGLADPHAITVVTSCRLAWEWHVKESKGRPPLVLLAHAVLHLCRAPKSREADDLAESMRHLLEQGWRPEQPSYAVDSHTARGRAGTPRDEWLTQWLTEGSVVVPDDGPKDWAAWILRWAVARGRLDPVEVEARIRAWDEQGRLVWGPDGFAPRPSRGGE